MATPAPVQFASRWFARAHIALAAVAASTRLLSADLYVAPDGLAEASGTLVAPTTLELALTRVAPGDTIHLRGGDYAFTAQLTIAREKSGAPDDRIHLVAYAPFGGIAEHPRLDFSGQAYAKTTTSAASSSTPTGGTCAGSRFSAPPTTASMSAAATTSWNAAKPTTIATPGFRSGAPRRPTPTSPRGPRTI